MTASVAQQGQSYRSDTLRIADFILRWGFPDRVVFVGGTLDDSARIRMLQRQVKRRVAGAVCRTLVSVMGDAGRDGSYRGWVTAFICRVTAVCAYSLPLMDAPVCMAINDFDRMIPSM